jgi:hypothetical protein
MATETADEDLLEEARALLQPGEIELNGLIAHLDIGTDEEAKLHRQTIEIGDIIAEHAEVEDDTFVYSGTDDPEFGLNQHQGLTLEEEEFVWECQQLRREDGFKVVFYYEKSADHEAILADAREAGYTVDGVEG